jgi:hypothetical protein
MIVKVDKRTMRKIQSFQWDDDGALHTCNIG